MKVYDLDTNTWTELNQVEGEVPHARSAHAAAVVGDVIYVIGGRFNSNDVNGMCVFFFFFLLLSTFIFCLFAIPQMYGPSIPRRTHGAARPLQATRFPP